MNRIYKTTIAGALAGMTFFTSCTKDLNLTPVSSITTNSFWKTQEDARGAATGMYVSLKTTANDIYRSEIRSDIYEGGISGTGGDYADIQANAITPANPGYPSWQNYYKVINDANLILKYVPSIEFVDASEKNRLLAEAHATRAYVYFVMTKVWGDLIIRTEPVESSDPSVTQLARSSQAEVFTLIKDDIEKALGLFPNNQFPAGRIRWSAPATNALKADVYLFTAKKLGGGNTDLNTVISSAEAVEAAEVELLPRFADIFDYNNKGNREYIMAIRHDVIEGGLFHHFTWFGSGLPANVSQESKDLILPTGQGIGLLVPTALVRNQFLEEDSRRSASFHEVYLLDDNGDSTYFTSIDLKHRGVVQTGNRLFTDDAILYRFADVILMKAEAKNALDIDPSAEMNKIRQRAFGDDFAGHEFASAGREANDEAILKERLLELMFEGKRWDDLVRFDKAFQLVPTLQGRTGQQHLLLFPIGLNVLSVEPLVSQNPGYL